MRILNVGIAVNNLEESTKKFSEVLGAKVIKQSAAERQKVKMNYLGTKDVTISLITPTGPESVVAKFLERKGEGLYHLVLKVDKIEETIKYLKSKGIAVTNDPAYLDESGMKITFIHPKSMNGVLIELQEF